MHAGRLNKKITIEQPTETQDGTGQAVKSWSTYSQPWAAIEPLRANEFISSQQIVGEATVRIRVRADSGITEKMRVNWNGKIYNIEGPPINISERDREMHLMCSEGANDG